MDSEHVLHPPGAELAARETEAGHVEVTHVATPEGLARAMLESVALNVLATDLEGRIVFVSSAAARMLGYTQVELQGRPLLELIEGPAPLPRFPEFALVRRESRIRHRDGRVALIEYVATPLLQDNQLIGHVVSFRDISYRSRMETDLQESTERWRSLVENAPAIIVMVDREARIRYINRTQPGFEHSEVIGADVLAFIMPEDRERLSRIIRQVFETGEAISYELHGMGIGKGPAWYQSTIGPVSHEGRVEYAIITAVDVTERKRAEDELKSSESRLRLAMQVAKMGSWEWDAETDRVRMSDELYVIYGLPIGSFAGSFEDFLGLVHEQDRERVRQAIQQAIAGGQPFQFNKRIVRPDGVLRILQVRGQALPTQNHVTRLVGVCQDVSEQWEAEEALRLSEQRNRATLASLQEGVLVLDARGVVLEANKAAERLIGLHRNDLFRSIRGTSGLSFIREDGSPFPEQEMPDEVTRVSGRAQPGVFVGLRLPDGQTRWVLAHTQPLAFDPAEGGYSQVASFFDITERKQLDDEIRRLNAELEDRVVQRTRQLELANKELEAFSYSVSHDLRAPLRSINGFSLALLEDYEDKLDDNGRDYLQRVRAASQRMADLIDDILQLSRLSRSPMRVEHVDLAAIAREIAEELHRQQPERQVELVIPATLVAAGDPTMLRAVLENLLGNAWKFTGKHEHARIELGRKQVAGRPAFFVCDDGAGFDMAFVDKLFRPFSRLHGSNEFEGTGIGLATVQRLIHRHGGCVWAEGHVEQGACFYFTLEGPKESP